MCCCLSGWNWLPDGRVWVCGTKTNSRQKASHVWGVEGNLGFVFHVFILQGMEVAEIYMKNLPVIRAVVSFSFNSATAVKQGTQAWPPCATDLPTPPKRLVIPFRFGTYTAQQSSNSATSSLNIKEATFAVKLSATMQLLLWSVCTPALTCRSGMLHWSGHGDRICEQHPFHQTHPFSWIFQPVYYLNPKGEAFQKDTLSTRIEFESLSLPRTNLPTRTCGPSSSSRDLPCSLLTYSTSSLTRTCC